MAANVKKSNNGHQFIKPVVNILLKCLDIELNKKKINNDKSRSGFLFADTDLVVF